MLVYIVSGYFWIDSAKSSVEIAKALDYAQSKDGGLYYKAIAFRNGDALRAELLDSAARNVRFECSGAECSSGVRMDVDERHLSVKSQVLEDAYFRCKEKGLISDCVMYIGEKPAQLELENIAVPQRGGRGETLRVSFEVKNSGMLNALDSEYSIKVYQKVPGEWEEKEILKQEYYGRVEKLAKGESKGIAQQFTLNAPGKYILKIVAHGEDAGQAKSEAQLEVFEQVASGCRAVAKGRTITETGRCLTEHLCEGCEFAFECSSRWIEEGIRPESIGGDATARMVYVQSPLEGGECK
ncbi:MAG TPA: hypothetical protein HA254_06010 [Candidatus Diapherotrites archaeon]|uniref:CARDB domain-containing protein n=1 Tax=Candidatus Iainarchaeum sp. TaxID=3101447 RepID=A0A7J4IXB2_9ARCH|nr:hypothetical protein [Candidatus Diapherotrites archaeon]